MAMWQLAAARSRPMGSRSTKPRPLIRDSVQKSRWFVHAEAGAAAVLASEVALFRRQIAISTYDGEARPVG